MTSHTLRDLALAAVAPAAAARRGQPTDVQLLHDVRSRVDPDGTGWWHRVPGVLADPSLMDASLVALAHAFDLTPAEVLAIALARSVDDDLSVGRALAQLQAPVGASRPVLGMLASAFAPVVPAPRRTIDVLANGNAVRCGALVALDEGAPLAERPLSVPIPLSLALADQDSIWPGASVGLAGDAGGVPLPRSVLENAERQAAGLRDADRALVIRSGSTAEARSVAAAVARALHRQAVFFEAELPSGVTPWLWLRRLVPVLCLDLAPGERRRLSRPPMYFGPLIVVCGPDGSVEISGSGTALNWRLPVPSPEERVFLWEQATGDAELAERMAVEHRHASGRIADLGRLAKQYAALGGRDHPTTVDVIAAARSGEGTGLDSLAQPMLEPIPDAALVMTPGLRADLEALLQRCRARDGLVHGLGPSAVTRYAPGVRALFTGPSGTGKTLAAGWLATQLGLPLFRVDLASVTSKYIGETEKNLAQLLARAEHAEVVLLFDEADALFGKRTEVREANDRFANAQTNYLLQRVESFDGITLLTSNGRGRFDAAFSRRLDAIVEFPLPGPEERRALWHTHLGQTHAVTSSQLNRLAASADLAGGDIRNVVLTAAVRAAQTHSPIEYSDLLVGVAGEYRKLGRQPPDELALTVPAEPESRELDGPGLRPPTRTAAATSAASPA